MNTGQIRKSKQTERFTVIPNAILEDKNLSLKAMGLLCYLLRLPKDWVINKTSLHKNLKDGRDAVLAAFKELQDFGYIEVEEIRERGKFVGFNYEVLDFPNKTGQKEGIFSENPEPEKPITENPESVPPITGKPITEKPITVLPISEKPELLSTDFNKNEIEKELKEKELTVPAGNLFGLEETPKNERRRKEKSGSTAPEIKLPWPSPEFSAAWDNWKQYKSGEHGFKYKTPQSQQAALNDLCALADGSEIEAIILINHAMAKGWKGFYLKKNDNGQQTNNNVKNGNYSDRSQPGTDAGANSLAARISANNEKYGF